MTVSISTNIHFDAADVSHRWFPGSDDCQSYGAFHVGGPGGTKAVLFPRDVAAIDAMVTHLAELKSEMLAAPAVITDGPKCASQNPDSQAWCYRQPGHGEKHRDADGQEWGDAPSFIVEVMKDRTPVIVEDDETPAGECGARHPSGALVCDLPAGHVTDPDDGRRHEAWDGVDQLVVWADAKGAAPAGPDEPQPQPRGAASAMDRDYFGNPLVTPASQS